MPPRFPKSCPAKFRKTLKNGGAAWGSEEAHAYFTLSVSIGISNKVDLLMEPLYPSFFIN